MEHNNAMVNEAINREVLTMEANSNEFDGFSMVGMVSDERKGEPMGKLYCNGVLVGSPHQTMMEAHKNVMQLIDCGIYRLNDIAISSVYMRIDATRPATSDSVMHISLWEWRINE